MSRGLIGFGEGWEGRGTEYLNNLREMDRQDKLAKLGQDLAAGNIDQTQYLRSIAAYAPEAYSKLALSQLGVDAPADVKSWMYMNQLPSDQQQAFKDFRRQQQWLNTGGAFINPNTGGAIPVTPKPEDMPEFRKQQTIATAEGNQQADQQKELATMDKVSPTIAKLYALNEQSPEGAYAESSQWIRHLTPGTSPEEKAVDLMLQARLDLAAPLAKELGVNPTDKDFQATLDRIFNMDSTQESRREQIKSLIDKYGIRRQQLGVNESFATMPGSQAEIQALSEDRAPSNITVSPENRAITRTIGGKTYVQQNGKWYEQ